MKNKESRKQAIARWEKEKDFFESFKFCCDRMSACITLEKNRISHQAILYHPEIRMFSVPIIKFKDAFSPIKYCPYCGAQLPENLKDEHYEIIKKELGENYLEFFKDGDWHKPLKELPSEFLTDEWWKKRGL